MWFAASSFLVFIALFVADTLSVILPFSVAGVVGPFSLSAPPKTFVNLLGPSFFYFFSLCWTLILLASACCGVAALLLCSLFFVEEKRPPLRACASLLGSAVVARLAMVIVAHLLCTTPPGLWGGTLGASWLCIGVGFAANIALLSSVLHVARFPHLIAPPAPQMPPLAAPPPSRGGGGKGG